MVSNPGSALGEAVGKLFEESIPDGVRDVVETRNHTVRPARLTNGSGNTYQIDAVVFDQNDNPIIIIDPKYIRYTKHNRDKGSWLCVAHYNLRKTFPTIRKSIAVLAGRWSAPSKALVRSFGVEILEVPFDHIVSILDEHGIAFNWRENDRAGARSAWEVFDALPDSARVDIAQAFTADIVERLRDDVAQVLDTDLTAIPRRISSVELLLKTEQDETMLFTYSSIAGALQALAQLVSDRPDIGDLIQQQEHPH